MQVKFINGDLVIEGAAKAGDQALDPATFSNTAPKLNIDAEPTFYVALDENGLLARTVSVTTSDRKLIASIVGTWIAEGFTPVPADLKTYAKLVRALVAANKTVAEPQAGAAADNKSEDI